mmetsp:Transcript_2608/g.6487  ORF Transcript_2608/g.6487 Transcript_2608/m.6487 type:complete len:240 (+) Transcript_2608:267-986(+)
MGCERLLRQLERDMRGLRTRSDAWEATTRTSVGDSGDGSHAGGGGGWGGGAVLSLGLGRAHLLEVRLAPAELRVLGLDVVVVRRARDRRADAVGQLEVEHDARGGHGDRGRGEAGHALRRGGLAEGLVDDDQRGDQADGDDHPLGPAVDPILAHLGVGQADVLARRRVQTLREARERLAQRRRHVRHLLQRRRHTLAVAQRLTRDAREVLELPLAQEVDAPIDAAFGVHAPFQVGVGRD